MSTRQELKSHVRQVKGLLNKIICYLDDQWLCPRKGIYLDTTVLTLLSKSLALARSTVCLVQNGFHEEAFASSRTLLELALNLHYITNGANPETSGEAIYSLRRKDKNGVRYEGHRTTRLDTENSARNRSFLRTRRASGPWQWSRIGSRNLPSSIERVSPSFTSCKTKTLEKL